MTMLPYELSYADYSTVYNSLSFVMASMMASTIYFFFHAHLVQHKYRTALCVSGLVTLIAMYHYLRIFNSWVEAYEFAPVTAESTDYICKASGKPFNDAYRYMDWLLTVPLLLIELILVMDLDKATEAALSVKLGGAAALMIVLGYPGEITLEAGTRWFFWFLAMIPFCYIVFTLFVGLKDAVDKQDPAARGLVSSARWVTIISWTTYPVVYILPMLGFDTATSSLVGIQVGYSISDFVAKCVVGLMVTRIAIAKSKGAGEAQAGLLSGSQSMPYGSGN
jgi:bacteriorhodopsin